jgi:hypothetical protein
VVVPDQAKRILDAKTWYEAPNRFTRIESVPQGQVASAANNLVHGYKPNDPVGYSEILNHPRLVPIGAGSADARLAIDTFDALNCAHGIGRGGSTYGDLKHSFLTKMYYLGDNYHDMRVTSKQPFRRNNGCGAAFDRATEYQRNGFFAYLIMCEMMGSLNIPDVQCPDLLALQLPTLFGYTGPYATDLQECYYCFVLPMVHFILEMFNDFYVSEANLILTTPVKEVVKNWHVRGKNGIWSNQCCMERLEENPCTLTFRDGRITQGCFYPYARVLLTCTDKFKPKRNLLHLTGGANGGERGTIGAGNEDIIVFPAGTAFPANGGVPAGPVVIRSNVPPQIIVVR